MSFETMSKHQNPHRLPAILGILLMLGLLIPLVSADSEGNSNEWLMFGRTLNHTRYDGEPYPIITGFNHSFYLTDADILSSPTIYKGSIYVGNNNNKFYRLNASNVSQILEQTSLSGAIQASPTIVNDEIYIGDMNGVMWRINASDLTQTFSLNLGQPIFSSVAYQDGRIYYATLSNNTVELNATSFAIIAIFQDIMNNSEFSSPAISDGYVYIGSDDGNLYQLNATNLQPINVNMIGISNIKGSPAVFNGSVYVGSLDGCLYQMNASNVSQMFNSYCTGDQVISSPAISDGYVYFGSFDGQVYQLLASNLSFISAYNTTALIVSSPAIRGTDLYIGSSNGKVYQLDANLISTSKNIFTTGDLVLSSPAVSNDYVYIGSFDNKLYQLLASNISATNGGCTENWQPDVNSCQINDTIILTYTDQNTCGTDNDLPVDNGTISSCNYCSEDIQPVLGTCELNNTQSVNYTDNNYFSCCSVTGLASDCDILSSPYNETSTQSCDFLTNDFNCTLDKTPVIHKKINVVCEMTTNDNYSCIVNVYQENGANSTLLSTNPEYKLNSNNFLFFPQESETRTSFTPENRLLNAYYTDKELRAGATYKIETKCYTGTTTIVSEYIVNPTYHIPDWIATRGIWFSQNAGYIMAIILIGILVLGIIIYYIKETRGRN